MNMLNTPLNTTVTSKGQVTIPAEIRRHLGIKPRDKVRFLVAPSGAVALEPAPSRLLAGYGAVTPRRKPEDFGGLRKAFAEGVAAAVQRTG